MAKFRLKDKVYFLLSCWRMEECPICKGTNQVKAKMFSKNVEIRCPAHERHKDYFKVEIERFYVCDNPGYIIEKRETKHTFYDPDTTKFIKREKRYITYTMRTKDGQASNINEKNVFKTFEEAKEAARLRNNEVDEEFKKQYLRPVWGR